MTSVKAVEETRTQHGNGVITRTSSILRVEIYGTLFTKLRTAVETIIRKMSSLRSPYLQNLYFLIDCLLRN